MKSLRGWRLLCEDGRVLRGTRPAPPCPQWPSPHTPEVSPLPADFTSDRDRETRGCFPCATASLGHVQSQAHALTTLGAGIWPQAHYTFKKHLDDLYLFLLVNDRDRSTGLWCWWGDFKTSPLHLLLGFFPPLPKALLSALACGGTGD